MAGAGPTTVSVEREIVKADPGLRRQMLLVLLLIVAIGLFALEWVPKEMATILAIARESPAEARARTVLLLGALVAPPVLLGMVAGVDTIRRSVSTFRTDRFPPPGMRVLRDTPVLRGRSARGLAIVMATLGALLIACCTALPVLGYRLGVAVQRGCPRAAAPR